ERPAVGIEPQAVHRHDARMLQAAGHLGFTKKARATVGMVGEFLLDLLQGDLPVQLLVVSNKDGPQSSFGVLVEDPEADAGYTGFAHGQWPGRPGIVFLSSRRYPGQAGLQFAIRDLLELMARRTDGADRSQAFLR